jgi:hypothetical protein
MDGPVTIEEEKETGLSSSANLSGQKIVISVSHRIISNLRGLNCSSQLNLVFQSRNTFLTYTRVRQTGQQHSSSFLEDKDISCIFGFSTLSFGIQ